MKTIEALQNIGQPFTAPGLCDQWDKILKVEGDTIIGEFIEAPADSCRLKQPVPPGLQKYQESKKQSSNSKQSQS